MAVDGSGNDSGSNSANAADQSLTLSAAILSPINSLFEAQVHSARAFLSFILQMGFGDRVTEAGLQKEKARLQDLKTNNTDENGGTLDANELQMIDEKLTRVLYLEGLITKYLELQDLKQKAEQGPLTDDESAQLQALQALDEEFEDANLKEDVHSLKFSYSDGSGQTHTIVIPALALIPIQPLGISKATFDFNLAITAHNKDFKQQQSGRMGDDKRPWFFIQPKRIEGTIQSESSMQSQRGIKIHVEVNSTPIPQGLSNLLTSLTQSSKVQNK